MGSVRFWVGRGVYIYHIDNEMEGGVVFFGKLFVFRFLLLSLDCCSLHTHTYIVHRDIGQGMYANTNTRRTRVAVVVVLRGQSKSRDYVVHMYVCFYIITSM